mgnify:CR=1 FL=1
MSGQSGKWREDQVLVICPGSQTTLAQLGCNELTPPARRFPTRMFRDPEDPSKWRPYHTYKRKKEGTTGEGEDKDEWEWVEDVDSIEGAVYPMQGESRQGGVREEVREPELTMCVSWSDCPDGCFPCPPGARTLADDDNIP